MPRLVALFAAASVLALAACQPAARASAAQQAPAPAQDAPAKSAPAPVPLPTPKAPPGEAHGLVLGIGEHASLAGGTLTLQRIAADSRCPKDAQCIWAGEVTLAFEYAPAAGAVRSFQLSERTQPRASLGERDIALTGFGPCPAGHAPASPTGCARLAFTASEMR